MLRNSGHRPHTRGWRIVLLASLGGTLEFYDFVIFGIFARDIAEAIFPSSSPLVSLMASFAAFAAGYLARPLGGIVLSHYGDRYGRRRVFLWSVFVMSGATLGMGSFRHAQWGVAASALMVALRLVQGFCLGGELPGALTYVVETAPRRRRSSAAWCSPASRWAWPWPPASASRFARCCRPNTCRSRMAHRVRAGRPRAAS